MPASKFTGQAAVSSERRPNRSGRVAGGWLGCPCSRPFRSEPVDRLCGRLRWIDPKVGVAVCLNRLLQLEAVDVVCLVQKVRDDGGKCERVSFHVCFLFAPPLPSPFRIFRGFNGVLNVSNSAPLGRRGEQSKTLCLPLASLWSLPSHNPQLALGCAIGWLGSLVLASPGVLVLSNAKSRVPRCV